MTQSYPGDHRHRWFVEQQTGHRFCQMCGKHDPPDPDCSDRPSALWTFVKEFRFRLSLDGPR